MGGGSHSRDDQDARDRMRKSTGTPVFKHDADIKAGKATAKVHDSLSPKGVKIRESRDSDAHPVSVPVAVFLDTTGSMATVPPIIQKQLNRLMGCFLDDKASGKKYLGDGYPAIMIGANDDFDAMNYHGNDGEGCLQVGQFESGLEIDDNLTSIWLTENGGGTYQESYELALYFMARHTVHDHFERRGKKGYMFMIGDEHAYPQVSRSEVKAIIGDTIEANIPLEQILKEVQERYHVFFVIPRLSGHYDDPSLERYWVDLLGQQNVIKLKEPAQICELIVAAVAICENHASLADLTKDAVVSGALTTALAPLSHAVGSISKYSADGLPSVAGAPRGTERL